ncbi:MAG: type II secretion system protein [Planctomycetes bacterium]|nr:type II secretion system protein [Planctomycetota bacterium]
MRRRDDGITLVEVTAAITIVGIVIALIVPAISRGSRLDRLLECRGHLKTLHEAQAKAPQPGAKEYGRAYWERLTKTSPPLVSAETIRCPFVEAPEAPPCHYFGPPPVDLSTLDAKAPLGCDMELSHSEDGKEGGNVLLKSGEVVTDHSGIWGSAVRQGKCRP